MSWFTKRVDTYDKVEPKVLKGQIDAAFHLGNGGVETNQKAVDDLKAVQANVAALTRVQQMFSGLPQTHKTHKQIAELICQENKWVAHHGKLVEATKRGYETLKAAAKALVDEAFAAGELEAEKKAKEKKQAADLQQRKDGNKDGKNADPKFEQRSGDNNQQRSGDNNQQRSGDNNQQRNDQQKDKSNQNQNNNKAPQPSIVVEKAILVGSKISKKDKRQLEEFLQRKS